jgi:hypothetical protein
MAIYFYTDNPKELLKRFNARIDQKEAAGRITTWERSEDQIYYTHKAKEWHAKAWLKPAFGTNRLTFYIVRSQAETVKKIVYGYYHGHLIETFLNHFDQDFTTGDATALPVNGDYIS